MRMTSRIRLMGLCTALLFFVVLAACGGDVSDKDNSENFRPNDWEPGSCVSPVDCDPDDTCYVLRAEEAVELSCSEPNEEGLADGISCSEDSDCASNFCNPTRFGDYCSTPCEVNGDCPTDAEGFAMECGEVEVEHQSGSDTIEACIRQDRDSCTSDADCDGDQACAVVVNADDDGLETVCMPDNGSDVTGETCTDDADCLGRLCHDGLCSSPCVEHDQCSDEQVCEEESVSLGDHTDDLEVCIPTPVITCNAPVHCEAEYMTCNWLTEDDEGALDGAICGMTNPDESELAASCSASSDCESDFCWASDDGTTGECTVLCEESERDCGDDQLCVGMAAGLGACLSECSRDEDCDGGNVCRLGLNQSGDALHQYCSTTRGAGETGDTCDESSDCATGHCLTVSTYDVTDEMCGGDDVCDDGYICRCPPDTPGCISPVCVSEEPIAEQDMCSTLCDPANGNDDCSVGDHDLTVCSENISTEVGGISETVSACALPDSDNAGSSD